MPATSQACICREPAPPRRSLLALLTTFLLHPLHLSNISVTRINSSVGWWPNIAKHCEAGSSVPECHQCAASGAEWVGWDWLWKPQNAGAASPAPQPCSCLGNSYWVSFEPWEAKPVCRASWLLLHSILRFADFLLSKQRRFSIIEAYKQFFSILALLMLWWALQILKMQRTIPRIE